MYSALLSNRTKTLFTSPILNPIKTQKAEKTRKTKALDRKVAWALIRKFKPERFPQLLNLWADKGSKWLYALGKWEEREKRTDALLGPRHPDQYPAKLVVEKFKEEDAPIQEWEEDTNDILSEKPYSRQIQRLRRKMRRKLYKANYARLIGKYSQPAIYEDARQIIADAINKYSPSTKEITEEEVERRENFLFSLIRPLSGIKEKLWKSNYELTRGREITLLQANTLSQITRLIDLSTPSITDRVKHHKLREELDYYSDKITEAVRRPPPGETLVYPYSFSPPGYQEPRETVLHPYNKLPYKDPNSEYSFTASNSFQIKEDLSGSIWNRIKNTFNSFFYNTTLEPQSPLSVSQTIQESISNTSSSSKKTTETSLVPIEPEEDAPSFMDFVNPKYSTFKMNDFNARHRDIKIATIKDIVPEFSKQSLKLEVVYGLYPKLCSILYGQFNPIDIVKYFDVHLAKKLLNKSRRDLLFNIASFHKIVKILKTRFKITRRKARRVRIKVKIKSIEMMARRKLNKALYGNVNHLAYYSTILWITPNPMEPFKWKIIRFKRRKRVIRRRLHDHRDITLFRMSSKTGRSIRRRIRLLHLRHRRRLPVKLKKIYRILGVSEDPKQRDYDFSPEQKQILKNHIRWPGRFSFASGLLEKETAMYYKKKFGIEDYKEESEFDIEEDSDRGSKKAADTKETAKQEEQDNRQQ